MMDYKQEVINFIEANGWIDNDEGAADYQTYDKEDNISIGIEDDEIVLIDDTGDFLHMEINKMAVFALLGYLFNYRYIGIDYKWE